MRSCPNCGQETARTQDWACPWCGYPLISGSFKRIPKTYQELKEERLHKPEPPVLETAEELPPPTPDTLPPEPAPEPEYEPLPETELTEDSEAEAVPEPDTEETTKPKHKRVVRLEGEPELEPEPKARPKPVLKPKAKPKAKPTPEPIPEPEPEPVQLPEPISATIPITVDELHLAYKADRMAADVQFTNKMLRVTGLVGRIAVDDIPDSPCVVLTSPDREMSRNVLCVFDKEHVPELNRLVTGQTVTVEGKFDSCTINILITDCTLAD